MQIENIDNLKILNSYRPTLEQYLFHEESAHENLIGGAVAGGKSTALVNDAIFFCLKWPGARVILSRKYLGNLMTTTWLTFQQWVTPLSKYVKKFNSNKCIFRNGSEVLFIGLGGAKELRKLGSLEATAIYIDESSDIESATYDFLLTRLRYKAGDAPFKMCLASNPCGGFIRERFIYHPSENRKFFPLLPKLNFYLDPEYLPSLEKSLPTNLYKAYVAGSWEDFGDVGQLFTAEAIDAAVGRKVPDSQDVAYGIDCGGSVSPYVLVKKIGNRFEIADSFLEKDSLVAAQRLALKIESKTARIKIDSIGIGQSVLTYLRDKGFNAIGVINCEKSGWGSTYDTLRDMMIYDLYIAMNKIRLPKNEKLRTELLDIRERLFQKKLCIETAYERRKRSGEELHYVTSLTMAMLYEQIEGLPEPLPFWDRIPLVSRYLRGLGFSYNFVKKKLSKVFEKKYKPHAMTKAEFEARVASGIYAYGIDPPELKEAIQKRKEEFDRKTIAEDKNFIEDPSEGTAKYIPIDSLKKFTVIRKKLKF